MHLYPTGSAIPAGPVALSRNVEALHAAAPAARVTASSLLLASIARHRIRLLPSAT